MTKLPVSSLLISNGNAPEPALPIELTENDSSHLRKTITDIFEEQVRRTPNSVAVEYEGREFTYEQLNQRSNQLGHYLRALGVSPGGRVGICVERSLEMIVGLLGILKAGATYVPLDRNYPEERLSYMVEDANVEIVLSQEKLAGRMQDSKAKLVFLDSEWEKIGRQLRENPANGTTPDHLAYIIYTSGSTGRPKGVCICHRNAVRLVRNTTYADLGADQVFLQFVSISFDVAAFEIWGALLNGARLMVFPAYTPSAEELGEWVSQHPVTTLWLTSGLFHQMVDGDTGKYFRHLRQLLAGGDMLSLRLVQKFLKEYPDCRLINGYGPTENGTFSTCGELRNMPADAATVIIGTPITNSSAYVLNQEMQVVPAGQVGELYLGGHGLAHGYWKQPAMTAEKFVPNPFGTTPGERLYRTGDLGRSLPNGTLEFLGRIDQQVKLRGYRIELGEIEVVLEQHPAVGQAVALVREDNPGDKRLVAYVVERTGARAGIVELREYLSRNLPEYMVPSALVLMEAFPLTANGKVDRRALPMPVSERPALEQPYVAPETATEKLLSNIWAAILHIDRVGAQDDFFYLGGNSLLAAQVIARVRKVHDVLLPLRSFFESPVLADVAQRFEAARRETSDAGVPPVGAVPRGEEIPLGFSQERVWFIQQLDPSSIAYHFQATLNISGPLDVPALEHSLTEMVKRHEILRTTFIEKDGRAIQVIHEPVPAALTAVHLEHMEKASLHEVRERLIQDEMAKRFDVSRLPLIRWVLLSFGEQEYLLLHIEHHFVHDGWSFNVFLGEFLELYKAFASGHDSPLVAPRFQFADFAVWQREFMRSKEAQAQLSYWTEKLSGSPPINELPTDHPRPRVQTFQGGLLRVPLPKHIASKLHVFSNQEEASLFVVMTSAFFALAFQYTRQADFCVGTSLANRQRPETEGLLGMLVNNVALRAQIPASGSFRDLLAQVRELTFEAYENQDVPFQDVVRSVNVNRDVSANPLFQTMFNFHNSPVSVPQIPELKFNLQEGLGNGSAKFDLGVIVIPASGQRLRLSPEWNKDTVIMLWEYNATLFHESTIRRMIAHYQRILEEVVADPERKVGQIDLLEKQERRQILEEWNDTVRALPPATIPELFEAQVERTPDAEAVVYEAQRLTYRELNQRANRLAHYLIGLGVSSEDVVALALPRSLEMVVALLAILKAGAAYLPLDPDYPAERLAFMLEDTQSAYVLIAGETAPRLPENRRPIVLDAPEMVGILAKSPAINPAHKYRLTPENLAYIIYTSGSTGTPKGVMATHGGVVRLVCNPDYIELQPWHRVAQASKYSFDASTFEIWGALLNGSSLVLIAKEVALDPVAYIDCVRRDGITTMFLTTALFNELILQNRQYGGFAGLKHLLFGGEAVDAKRVRQLLDTGAPERLLHVYGPTETTTFATYFEVGDAERTAETIAIGGPIGNTRVYVLDENFQPVPVGVGGELYIAGAGLARGYVKRPDLTAERFLPNPYGMEPGTRMYRTGDLARWRGDGNLEFLGRRDDQVKIRGFRIELGEIEAGLREQSGVQEAVVVAREDQPGEKRLVGYVVAVPGQAVDSRWLREQLGQSLPEYMVPAAIVVLEKLPLTAHGKLDRKALPVPEFVSGVGYRAPRTPEEEILCGLFAEVLGVERVGIADNFFELGGHSIMATRLVSRIRTMLGVELAIRSLFEAPTVDGLSMRLREGGKKRCALEGEARPKLLPLSYAQQRLWFLNQLEGSSSTEYNLPEVLRLRGELDRGAIERTINTIVERHESLRTHFGEVGGEAVQVIEPELRIAVPVEDLSGLGESEQRERVQAAMRQEANAPFDLARGPVLRMKLLKLGDEDHILLRTMHHIVSDGWSQGVFNREFEVLYEAYREGRENPLPALAVQYADFAIWQRKWLEGGALEEGLRYWKEQLKGISGELELPRDRPRPPVQTFVGEACAVTLPKSQLAALKRLSQENQATLYMTLLAGFAVLLWRYSGQEDIVVGSPIANRQEAQLEEMIGFFVNTLVMRVGMKKEMSFRELLKEVRKTALEGYRYQDVPFERLVEELSPQRSLNTTPIFQVVFALQNAPWVPQQMKALEVERIARVEWRVRFDLEVHMLEHGGGLTFHWVYNRDLFDGWRIEQMARHCVEILEVVSGDPGQTIESIALLDEREARQILVEWNLTDTAYPLCCIHEQFERQAAETPKAVAVLCGQESVSYLELNLRANQIAHRLLRLGVRQEVLVGICMARSLEMIAALLGILKAGGVYVPLAADLPARRREGLIADSCLRYLVTTNAYRALWQGTIEHVVTLDGDGKELAGQSSADPGLNQFPGSPAYVNFTSGSTGQPKGVLALHAGVMRLVSQPNYMQLDGSSRFLQLAPLSFDAATLEIWGALLNGGSLVVMPGDRVSIEEIGRVIREYEINTVWLTAGLFHEVVDQGLEGLRGVQQLLAGGDVLSPDHVKRMVNAHPQCRVINGYGPTENTTFTCCCTIRRAKEIGHSVPLGFPINNTRVYVLDENFQPVPVGVGGELYIAGAGLARGYVKRPDLTAERFLPNPYGMEPGTRMYRTGDLARWRGDGNLEFLGRRDDQVKIRGFRIELGEIEAGLREQSGVQEAVVVAREDQPGEKRLVGYVVAVPGQAVDSRWLREQLGQSLPEYMVPAAIVVLEKLPLTAHGKLDRKALPAPEFVSGVGYRAPRTPEEEILCGLFAEVLGVERVGIADNFFELGGHSIMATRLVSRIRTMLNTHLQLRDVFLAGTVEGLSALTRLLSKQVVTTVRIEDRYL